MTHSFQKACFMHRLIAVHGFHGTFVRLKLIYARSSLFIYSASTDLSSGTSCQGTCDLQRMKHLVDYCLRFPSMPICARKFERNPRDVFPRESEERSLYPKRHTRVNLRTSKNENTCTLCRVTKTTFSYTTRTNLKQTK